MFSDLLPFPGSTSYVSVSAHHPAWAARPARAVRFDLPVVSTTVLGCLKVTTGDRPLQRSPVSLIVQPIGPRQRPDPNK